MMKGIRGLLEKDFRLFFRQGGNLFLVLVFVALFFILTGKKAAAFIAMYIPSVWRYIQVIRSVMMKMAMVTHIYFLYP